MTIQQTKVKRQKSQMRASDLQTASAVSSEQISSCSGTHSGRTLALMDQVGANRAAVHGFDHTHAEKQTTVPCKIVHSKAQWHKSVPITIRRYADE